MTPDQIFAFVAALLMQSTEPDFDRLHAGGYDARYPVAVVACPQPNGVLEVEGKTLICGTVSVPENYDKPEGRRIPVQFAVLKSHSESALTDPVVYLHGGPGAGTLSSIGLVEWLFDKHRRDRDVVTFDQRAAGLTSSTVRCTGKLAENIVDIVKKASGKIPDDMSPAMFAPCLDELKAAGVDLPQYNTPNNARDVRAITSALGYPEYNIVGISYGTRLALEVMRTAPEGVRAVVIDSVAPTSVFLYDDFYGPHDDAIEAVVNQCLAQPACAAAYPDLQAQIVALGQKLITEPIPAARGLPALDRRLFVALFDARNGIGKAPDMTRFIPRMVAELTKGDTTTLDFLLRRPDAVDPTAADRLAATGAKLTDEERALALAALEAAGAMKRLDGSAAAALTQLKASLTKAPDSTGLAEVFDRVSTDEAGQIADLAGLHAMATAYALLPTQPQTRETLAGFVDQNFPEPGRTRLTEIVASMSEADVARTLTAIAKDTEHFELAFGGTFNLAVYACQEDVPFNSFAGFKAINEKLDFPFLVTNEDIAQMQTLYDICAVFPHDERPGFHDQVISDIPTLVMGGFNDTQTNWKWAPKAAETLSNAQTYLFPEAGHGSMAFSPCANDMTVSFIQQPGRKLDDGCIAGLAPKFVLPGDPLTP